MGTQGENPDSFDSEMVRAPLPDGRYYKNAGRLPSWKEFADGTPVSPPFSEDPLAVCSEESAQSGRKGHLSSSLETSPILHLRSMSHLIQQTYPSPSYDPLQNVPPRIVPPIPSVIPDNLNLPSLVDAVDLAAVPQRLDPTCYATQKCDICGRFASDLGRHKRTHDKEARFKCLYPKTNCPHKSGQFHRKYYFKMHLLDAHFALNNIHGTEKKNLSEKLRHEGTCSCGRRMKASEWLVHIITREADGNLECHDLREKIDAAREDQVTEKLIHEKSTLGV